MIKLDSYQYDIDNCFTIEEFRNFLDQYGQRGATHLQLSYQDYGDPIVNIFEKQVEEERDVPVLFYTIKNKIGWSKWCDIVGGNHYALNEGYSPDDNEVFYCTKSQAEELRL